MLSLHIKEEVDNVAVLHHIFLALTANKTLCFGICHSAAGLHIGKGNDLGTYKAALKVGVDLTGSLGRFGSFLDGPGTALIRASSQEGDQTKQGIGTLDQLVQTGFVDTQLFHKHCFFIGVIKLSNISLQLAQIGIS